MLSYSRIVKTAYRLTVENPLLWLFGLFVIGGFNLNFLFFRDIPLRELSQQATLSEVVVYFQQHPWHLAMISFLILFIAISLLVLSNWCRVMLILSTKSILENKGADVARQFKTSRKYLWTVIKISLLTSLLMLVVSAGLLGAPFWLVKDISDRSMLWTSGVIFIIPLAFTISGINIFTTFFAVVFGQPFKKALNLGTDFFLVNWGKILGLAVLLAIIYIAAFAGGAALIYSAKIFFRLLSALFGELGILKFSAIISLAQVLTGAFLWLILAGLNVFFNAVLLLLFLQLTTPLDNEEEKEKRMVISPASSSF